MSRSIAQPEILKINGLPCDGYRFNVPATHHPCPFPDM